MKVFVVLCLVAGAFGSLEPAGYQPPSNRYIPANRQSSVTPSRRSQYLPPVEGASSNQYNSQASSSGASQRNVNNQYLAPLNSQQNSNQGSARNYLAPAIDRASFSQYNAQASSFGASQKNLDNQYLTPFNSKQNLNQGPAKNYLASAIDRASSNQYNSHSTLSGASQRNSDNQYLAPFNSQHNSNQGFTRNYLAPAIDRASSDQYKPYSSSASSSFSSFSSPSYQFSPSSSDTSYSASSSTYSAPTNSYSPPSNSYRASSQGFNRMAAARPSSQYLLPNAEQGYSSGRDYKEESEPANYNFEYKVNDGYGNDFGHKENRQDEKTYGIYSVILPDGRKQVVEYEASDEGFRPKISYEEIEGGFKNAKSQNLEGPY